jgi:putative oxidoreductase
MWSTSESIASAFSASLFVAKMLVALIFVMNALGIIDQAKPAHELVAFGIPVSLAPAAVWSGRIIQLIGVLLLFRNDRLAAIGSLLLVGFLAPATVVAHSFWSATADAWTLQFINFLKNLAIIGGLLSIACTYGLRRPDHK